MSSLGQVPENTLGEPKSALQPLLNFLQERASAWPKEADANRGISPKRGDREPGAA